MGSVGQPPVLGGMIASALVGTFLGILLAYGFVGAAGRPAGAKDRRCRQGIPVHQIHVACQHAGLQPGHAIEFGRKVLFSTDRPTFSELEGHVKGKK